MVVSSLESLPSFLLASITGSSLKIETFNGLSTALNMIDPPRGIPCPIPDGAAVGAAWFAAQGTE